MKKKTGRAKEGNAKKSRYGWAPDLPGTSEIIDIKKLGALNYSASGFYTMRSH